MSEGVREGGRERKGREERDSARARERGGESDRKKASEGERARASEPAAAKKALATFFFSPHSHLDATVATGQCSLVLQGIADAIRQQTSEEPQVLFCTLVLSLRMYQTSRHYSDLMEQSGEGTEDITHHGHELLRAGMLSRIWKPPTPSDQEDDRGAADFQPESVGATEA